MKKEKIRLPLMVKYTGDNPPKEEDIKVEGTIVIGDKVIEINGVKIIKKEKVDKLI